MPALTNDDLRTMILIILFLAIIFMLFYFAKKDISDCNLVIKNMSDSCLLWKS